MLIIKYIEQSFILLMILLFGEYTMYQKDYLRVLSVENYLLKEMTIEDGDNKKYYIKEYEIELVYFKDKIEYTIILKRKQILQNMPFKTIKYYGVKKLNNV